MLDDEHSPLGYKRPLVWTRFQKGTSGNPNGRPRKSVTVKDAPITSDSLASAIDDILRSVSNRALTLADGKKITAIEAVFLAQQKAALQGSTVAQREILQNARDLEGRDKARTAQQAERDERLFQYFVSLKGSQQESWDEAASRGTQPDCPWPHSDDILIFQSARTWRVRGPFDERGVTLYNSLRASRDLNFTRLIIDILTSQSRQKNRKSVYLIWVLFDIKLPLRWQWSGAGLFERMQALSCKTLDELYKLEAAQELDCELRPMPVPSPQIKREVYKDANTVMKPLLKSYGYRSLAEFEAAYEKHGPDLKWERVKAGGGSERTNVSMSKNEQQ